MNITHTDIGKAAAGKRFCGYSLVRRVAAGVLVAGLVAGTAAAGPRQHEREREREERDNRAAPVQVQRDSGRYERAQPRMEERRQDERRQFDARSFDARAEEQRRNLQMQQDQNSQDAFRRSGRLTPDERRDLRRQINEAGMDLYPNRPRR